MIILILSISLLYLGFTAKSENHQLNNIFYKTTEAFNYSRSIFSELAEGNTLVPMSIFINTYLAAIFKKWRVLSKFEIIKNKMIFHNYRRFKALYTVKKIYQTTIKST